MEEKATVFTLHNKPDKDFIPNEKPKPKRSKYSKIWSLAMIICSSLSVFFFYKSYGIEAAQFVGFIYLITNTQISRDQID